VLLEAKVYYSPTRKVTSHVLNIDGSFEISKKRLLSPAKLATAIAR
jgi:hypothetical protein